jgi:hypothetical protein
LVVFLTIRSGFVTAQRFEFGAGAGICHYRGDLQPSYFPRKIQPGFELFGRYNLSMTAVVRANLLLVPTLSGSSVESSDPFVSTANPGYGFSSFLGELGFFGEYNFFNYRNPRNRFIFGSPYLFGGPAILLLKSGPIDNFLSDTLVVTPTTFQYSAPAPARLVIHPAVVMGVGYKQQLGQYFNLGFQASGRFLFSDALDQVVDREKGFKPKINPDGSFALDDSGNIINEPALKRQIGNKSDRDSYFFISLSLSYTIKEIICPFKYEKKQEK